MYETEIDAFCLMQASPRTRDEYRKDLTRWFESGFPLTVDGVSRYKAHLTENYKQASAGRFWSTVRTFHRWLVQRGVLEHSPFELVKAPKRTRQVGVPSPSDNDVNALVASCRTPRETAVVLVLLSGLRASEVTNLRADDIHFTDGYGYYLVFTGKGDKQRVVPIGDEVVQAINDLPNVGSDWLVHNNDGTKLTYDAVNGLVDSVSKRAGVRIHPHLLRHHYGTRMVRAGVNVIVLSKLLGHDRVDTTERYVTMDLSDLVEASRLDPRTNGGIRIVPSSQDNADADASAGRGTPVNVASA